MALMEFIRKMAQNRGEKSKKFKEMQEDFRLHKTLEDRQKSSNERELEGIRDREREERITEELEVIKKRERADSWKGKNIFAGHRSILYDDGKVLANNNRLLDQKNIFANQGNMFIENKRGSPNSHERMFFRW